MKLILPFEFLPGKRVGELPSERRQLRDRGSIVFRSTPGSYTIKLGFFTIETNPLASQGRTGQRTNDTYAIT
jgi:hypothetical protein